jgi:hypothetical protein
LLQQARRRRWYLPRLVRWLALVALVALTGTLQAPDLGHRQ